MAIDDYEWNKACLAVVAAGKGAKPGALINYAVTYASAGMGMYRDKERRVQAFYILCNLAGWRGEEAQRVKAYFKAISKEW